MLLSWREREKQGNVIANVNMRSDIYDQSLKGKFT